MATLHRLRLLRPPAEPGELLCAAAAAGAGTGARREATPARTLFLALAPGRARVMVPLRSATVRGGRATVRPGEYEDLCRETVVVREELTVPVDWPAMKVLRVQAPGGEEVALCAWGPPEAPAFVDVAAAPEATAATAAELARRGAPFALDPFTIFSRLVSPMAISVAKKATEHRTLLVLPPESVTDAAVSRLQRWLVDSQLQRASDAPAPWVPPAEDARVATDADLASAVYVAEDPTTGDAVPARTFVLPDALRAEVLVLGRGRYAVRLTDLHPDRERKARSAARLPAIALQVAAVLEGRIEPVPRSEAEAVREAYRETVVRAAWGVSAADLRDPFLGPKPTQMGATNALTDEIFRDHYAVTLKADGERTFLVCHAGKAYLLDSDLNVNATGVPVPADMNGVWLDGEMIREGRTPVFAAFDAYVGPRRRSVVTEPLLPKRDAVVRDVVRRLRDRVPVTRPIQFQQKLHVSAPTIADAVRRLDAQVIDGTVRYKTDGYVFTPKDVGPFDAVFGRRLGRRAPRGTRNPSLLKWKPPGDLTVDVVLGPREVGRERAANGQELVGYAARAAGTPDLDDAAAAAALAGLSADLAAPERPYELVEVPDMVVWLSAADPRADDGTEIVPGESVVEVSVHPNAAEHGGRVFRPRLVRADKTAVLRRHAEEGSDGGAYAANNIDVVLSTVQFAYDPLTREALLAGDAAPDAGPAEAAEVADRETYFLRSKAPRSDERSAPLRRAHRMAVNKLVAHVRAQVSPPETGARVLDIACGQGADLHRWFSSNGGMDARVLAAFDLNADNLLNGKQGLVRRLIEDPASVDRRVALSVRSMTEPIDAETAASAKYPALDAAFQELLRDVPVFDIALCNFALHYACGSAKDFAQLAATVGARVAEDGIFVATFLDRDRVLAELGKAKEVEGRVAGRTVWSIRRARTGAPRAWGEKMDFFLESIGIPTTEYLVDIGAVREELAKVGLPHVDVVHFDELGTLKEIQRARLAADHVDALSRLSSMYVAIVASRKKLKPI